MRRLLAALAAALVVVSTALAQAPAREPVREGSLERLMLDDGAEADAATWNPAEASVAVDKKHARHGDTALRLHIDVNWQTGEKAYPIGWPRMNRKWPDAACDWSRYDYFEFSVYTESSRTTLPKSPLGINIYDATGKKGYTRDLSDLQLGQWVDYRLPVAELNSVIPSSGMQFYISESQYRDGDVLDFWIDNISLSRHTQPTVAASTLAEQAITTTTPYLTVDLNLMGVRGEQKADVTWQIARAGGRSVASGKLNLGGGKGRVYLTLPPKGLTTGVYDVTLKAGTDTPTPFKLLVAPSPWQEVRK